MPSCGLTLSCIVVYAYIKLYLLRDYDKVFNIPKDYCVILAGIVTGIQTYYFHIHTLWTFFIYFLLFDII